MQYVKENELLLIFPPHFPPFQPHLALPSLAASLSNKGINTAILDMNLDFFYFCFKPERLTSYYEQCRKILDAHNKESDTSLTLIQAVMQGQQVIADIPNYLEVILGKRISNIDNLLNAQVGLNNALKIVSAAHGNFRLDFSRLAINSAQDQKAYESLIKCFFRNRWEKQIAELNPSTIGFSIASLNQVSATITLSRAIKENSPDTAIIFGGSIPTYYSDSHATTEFLMNECDFILGGEADASLVDWIHEKTRNIPDYSKIPGLFYKERQEIKFSGQAQPISEINTLPTPDFGDLPLHKYFCPNLTIPVLASRGCNWGMCTFCDHGYVYGRKYRQRTTELVIEDLATIHSKTGATQFTFYDESIPHNMLIKIAQGIKDSGFKFNWSAYSRCDRNWTAAVGNELFQAGCRVLSFGAESGSDKVLHDMRKGISAADIDRTVSALQGSGIWMHLYYILGFPGESEFDLNLTTEKIKSLSELPVSYGIAPFGLARHSYISKHPDSFGISQIRLTGEPFETLDFKYSSPVSQSAVSTALSVIAQAMGKSRWWQILDFPQVMHLFPLSVDDGTKELMHLVLKRADGSHRVISELA